MDRNLIDEIQLEFNSLSLSARRAWIEIAVMRQNPGKHYVALRKESVDRNIKNDNISVWARSRSPQGERG